MSNGKGTEWQRVRQLLAEALELRPGERSAFIESRCVEEPLERRELLSLLRSAELARDLLEPEHPASDATDSSDGARPASGSEAFVVGQTFGHYRLEEKIGEGGMGTVFRARDERLGRDVALKTVLIDHLSGARRDDLLERFDREMRLLASLNHPNVLQIYDAGEFSGIPFAVTELLDGQDLATVLRAGPLTIRRAVDLGIQLAQGLSAAHQRGIVHRDLKPANLFLTRDDTLKILDFGIAKLFAQDAAAMPRKLTSRGWMLGTPSYMSPEQACGEECDHRADLFAFGAILYEMTSGQRAFNGRSFLEIQHQVIRQDPTPLLTLRPEAGAELARIVERCLEKDPQDRIPSAEVLVYLLGELRTATADHDRDDAPAVEAAPAAPRKAEPEPVRKSFLTHALTAVLACGLTLTALHVFGPGSPPPPAEPPRLEHLTQYTRDSAPGVSRDGALLTYLSDRDGQTEVRLRQLKSGVERLVTSGHGAPEFDPAAEWILFVRQSPDSARRPRQQLFRANVLRPSPQLYLDDALLGSWSPDGEELAFVREDWGGAVNSWKLAVIGTAAVEAGKTDSARFFHDANAPISHLRWSPDGRFLYAVVESSAQGASDELLRADVKEGVVDEIDLGLTAGRLSRPAFAADGGRLFIAHSDSLTGYLQSSRILSYDLDGGLVETGEVVDGLPQLRLKHEGRTETWVPARVHTLERLSDRALALDAVTLSQQLLEIDLTEPGRPSRWLTRGRSIDRQPVYLGNGEEVIFSSNRSGNVDLWRWSRATGIAEPLLPHPEDDWDPTVTPAGRTVLWSSNRDGALEIYRADLETGTIRPLTEDRAPAENPSISADGQWVLYSSGHPRHSGLRRVRIDGSDDQLVHTEFGRAHPEISPSGRYALFHDHLIDGRTTVRVVEVESGEPTDFAVDIRVGQARLEPGVALGRARWRPDERAIAFVGITPEGLVTLFEQDFDPRQPTDASRRILFSPPLAQTPESFAYSPDGRRLVVSLMERTSSIMALRFAPRP